MEIQNNRLSGCMFGVPATACAAPKRVWPYSLILFAADPLPRLFYPLKKVLPDQAALFLCPGHLPPPHTLTCVRPAVLMRNAGEKQ